MKYLLLNLRQQATRAFAVFALLAFGITGNVCGQTISTNQLEDIVHTLSRKGVKDILAIRYLDHEEVPGFDIAIVGGTDGRGWRILVFGSDGESRKLNLRWDSGYLADYFGVASADDVSVERLPSGEQLLVFEACAAHACPIVFGVALYSPWTKNGYIAYSTKNDLKYEKYEKGTYCDELANLVNARKNRWKLNKR